MRGDLRNASLNLLTLLREETQGSGSKKRYAKEKRTKVHQVRKVGVCIRCKLVKTSVSLVSIRISMI